MLILKIALVVTTVRYKAKGGMFTTREQISLSEISTQWSCLFVWETRCQAIPDVSMLQIGISALYDASVWVSNTNWKGRIVGSSDIIIFSCLDPENTMPTTFLRCSSIVQQLETRLLLANLCNISSTVDCFVYWKEKVFGWFEGPKSYWARLNEVNNVGVGGG